MSDELILRDYLFKFLRSPDYITDVNYYLPKYLAKDPAFAETQRVLSWEHERYRLKVIDFAKQLHPQTATWGLDVWEEELGLSKDLTADLELRRAKVMAKLLGASPMTVTNTNKLVNLFTDDGSAYVDELPEDGTIKIIIPSKEVHLDEMRNSLDEMLPAHLVYYFQRIINIDDDDGDTNDEGKPDVLTDITDKMFFLHADFPIVENVPYGKRCKAPKYDGLTQAGYCAKFDSSLQYSGNKISDAARFGELCKWWFKPTGYSTFSKEYLHNGIIRYDGLKPHEIEYDEGIDELGTVEVISAIEEDTITPYQFNGNSSFDGLVNADSQKLPNDNGGDLSIIRSKRFNGKIHYDGDDINYFNGAVKADGNFAFDGNGAKAVFESITDKISGFISYSRKFKDTPLSFYNPELFDFVPKTLDTHVIKISTDMIADTVEPVADEGNALSITKAVKYSGVKQYDGGDLNYYNGGIKADGKFTFIDKGNRAEVEILAIDLNENLNMLRKKKNTPPIYIENIDFVSTAYDETLLAAQIDCEDFAEPLDSGGEMIIKRRTRYDGILTYQGYFDYPANASKRYNGALNYNNNCRVTADGTIKYDGTERYGGRTNQSFIEYATDLNGNPKVIETEKIPVATRSKLGFVIVGSNLNVDDGGRISLSKNLNSQPMVELESGVLKTLFESRRG